MAPKRPAPAAAASGSASDASDAEGDAAPPPHHHHHPPSATDPSKTPPPNPNPKSSAAPSSTPASASVAADSAAAGSDSAGAYDSDGDGDAGAHRRPAPKAASPKPGGNPKPRSPDINSDSDNSAAPVGSDAELDQGAGAGAGADSDDDNISPLRPPRHSRAEAAIIKPISSRPMDPPRRSAAASEPRVKRPRSAAVAASSAEQMKRPSRLWSPDDELVILRGLATYRAKSGVLPGSTNDIGKLHRHIRSQLSVKVSSTQLSDKVRRLKQKYQLLATRAKNGRDQDFPTPHDHNIYEHAKKVWWTRSGGSDRGGGGHENAGGGDSEEVQDSGDSDEDMDSGRDDRDRSKNRKLRPITMANGNGIGLGVANANGRAKSEFEKGKDAFPYLWEIVEELSREHPSGAAFKKAFEVLEGSKARVMEEKLRKYRLMEIRQQLRRMDLMKETVKMVLDALESAD